MKLLSLDIGSYSIKAVELDVSFGRVELADYLIERVAESELHEVQEPKPAAPPSSTAEGGEAPAAEKTPARQLLSAGQLAAIRRILSERSFRFDRLSVNFPRAWATTRIFHFPTKDRKTIQSSLSFELDDDIPFSMDEIVHDFSILSHDGTNSTVFSAVALNSDMTALISELQMLGLDPDMVTIEAWCLGHVLKRAIPKEYEGRPVCIVNMGNKQTSIHMYVAEGPVLTHVSTCAGADITRAIAQTYNLGYDQAEKAKVDGAFLLTETHFLEGSGTEKITPEQRQFSATIADALTPMLREIKQTLMSYKSHYKMSPRAIFITGGTSLIPNLPLYLEEQLKLPVFPFSYISRIVGQTLQLSEASEAQIASATGLGLTIVKPDRNTSINFRKDLFSKRGGLGSFDFRAFKRPLRYVAASLAFVYVNLIVQGIILSSRSSKQDAQLERAIKTVVGAVNPSLISTYKNSPSTLRSAVTKELAKYKDAGAAPVKPRASAFELLNKVSAAIPKDMTLDISTFQVKEGKLRLAGLVDQVLNANRVAKALEESKLVTEVAKDKVEEDPKTKKVKFDFSAKVAEAAPATGALSVKTR